MTGEFDQNTNRGERHEHGSAVQTGPRAEADNNREDRKAGKVNPGPGLGMQSDRETSR